MEIKISKIISYIITYIITCKEKGLLQCLLIHYLCNFVSLLQVKYIFDSNKLMTYLFWSPMKIIDLFRCL